MRARRASEARDEAREREWLESAAANIGVVDARFVEQALCRLAIERELHGDRWADVGFERLLTKLEEEVADIGTWGVLALQAVETDPDISDVMREHLWLLVHVAVALGACSYQALTLARDDL